MKFIFNDTATYAPSDLTKLSLSKILATLHSYFHHLCISSMRLHCSMRVHWSGLLLFIGLAASVFIFLTSQFAIQYDGEQPVSKTFQTMLHNAYAAYKETRLSNLTSSVASYDFGSIGAEVLDFTNSSRNWGLTTHTTFSDLTHDVAIESLLLMFGAGINEDYHNISVSPDSVGETPKNLRVAKFNPVVLPSTSASDSIHKTSNSDPFTASIANILHPAKAPEAQIVHPAAPNAAFDPSNLNANYPSEMKCTVSFEPTCEMYPYVRFWNQRFYPEDCYASPLTPPLKGKTPWNEQKYVVFEPDYGGWNNIRMAAETVIMFAHATGRTLVLPPKMVFYLLNKNAKQADNESAFDKFFDFRKVAEGLNIISMDDFITHVIKTGLLSAQPVPQYLSSQRRGILYKYIEETCYSRAWEPGKFFMGFNLSTSNPGIFGTFDLNKATQPRYKEMVAHGRELIPYNQTMDSHRAIYFYGRYDTHRMLTHFYTYLYWEDAHTEDIYKRIVRDRLHYHDDIFCGSGRVVKLLHEHSALLPPHKPVQSATAGHPLTKGGNTNQDATYFAFHIRRGDFQYKDTRLPAEQIWANTKHLLNSSVSTLIYIATDERNKSFFAPFMQQPFSVRFLDDFQHALASSDGTPPNMNHVGMIEQVICANAHTFIATPQSSFSGYITRMRGK